MTKEPANVAAIFEHAVQIEPAHERTRYVEQACGGDDALRARVESLLRANDDAGSFLDKPPEGLAATVATSDLETLDDGVRDLSLSFLQPSNKADCIGSLGQYEVFEVVGRGGMGVVLRAFDSKLNRVVAIKAMAPELAANPMAVKRFMREARAAAAVSHDHVVTIHAIEELQRPPFIVMEFVSGQSLQQKIDHCGSLQLTEILRIGAQIGRGLAAAHEQGLVHRDVKPANILLENGVERVKLTDFGLARAVDDVSVTQTGQIAGTPQFMSPEQAQGHPIDVRSDLFSLGSVLYTMCTGRPPFRGETALAMLRRVADDDPRSIRDINGDVPGWLESIIFKLLAKHPDQRFQSAEEVATLLSQHLAHLQSPSTARKPEKTTPPPRKKRPSPFLPYASTIAALLIIGVFVAGAIGYYLTDSGTVIIKSEIQDVQLDIHRLTHDSSEGKGRKLKWAFPGTRVTGSNSVRLRSGSYIVFPVTHKDSVELSQTQFILGRSGRIQLQVQRKVIQGSSPITESRRFAGHTGTVTDVDITLDGRLGLSCGGWPDGDESLRLWDMATGEQIRKFEGHNGQVLRAKFSPDGRYIVSGGSDHTARVWDVKSGKEIAQFIGEKHGWVHSLAITPDSTQALIGRGDHSGVFHLWELKSKKLVRSLQGDPGRDLAVAISPDGQLALTACNDDLTVWNLPSGERLRTIEGGGDKKFIQSVAFAKDSKRALAASLDKTIRLWDVQTGKELKRFNGHTDGVLYARFTPDEKHVVSSSHDKTLRVWNVASGKEVARSDELVGSVWAIAISPDGRFVLGGGGNKQTDTASTDFMLRLWRLPSNLWSTEVPNLVEQGKLSGHSKRIKWLSFLSSGRRAVSGSGDRSVRLWDVSTGRMEHTFFDENATAVMSLAVSADDRIAVSGHYDGRLQFMDLDSGVMGRTILAGNAAVRGVKFAPQSELVVAACEDGVIRFFDRHSAEDKGRIETGSPIRCMDVSPDGKRILIGRYNASLELYDVTSRKLLKQFVGHMGSVLAVAFAPAGDRAVTASSKGKVFQWDAETGRRLNVWDAHQGSVESIVYSSDGRKIVSGGMDRAIRVWDAASARELAHWSSKSCFSIALAISSDGNTVLAGGGDHYDVKSKNWISENDYAIRILRPANERPGE